MGLTFSAEGRTLPAAGVPQVVVMVGQTVVVSSAQGVVIGSGVQVVVVVGSQVVVVSSGAQVVVVCSAHWVVVSQSEVEESEVPAMIAVWITSMHPVL